MWLRLTQKNFVVKAEQHGIPQTRHRVILLGVRKDIEASPKLLQITQGPNVEDMIFDLPKLRSGFSKGGDSPKRWHNHVSVELRDLAEHARKDGQHELADGLAKYGALVKNEVLYRTAPDDAVAHFRDAPISQGLRHWISGNWPRLLLNHETRGHMDSDLRRYAYAAVFAKTYRKSPKGADEFALPGLAPAHENWKTGAFSDRFRVQMAGQPATTITSHISKDGHYFIHPDPTQCRSLTVREAARLQTFPDDYFFCGPRTSQYTQVGNAVPPYLANQLAQIVFELLK